MNPNDILTKYYKADSEAYRILFSHSEDVARKALQIARLHPEMNLDLAFIEEAAMLHDVGVFLCNAPSIDCHGEAEYICHGYLGAGLMRSEGYPRHALVCERHTGAGITREEIETRNLPLPYHDMLPLSLEEQIICYADKFFSKTNLGKEKSIEKIKYGLAKYGEPSVARFTHWQSLFQ
ncbi:phosphohydrolase [Bacteroidia bacterium]|nr:phosphohydrolase [Bacteroidia bacterium]